MDAYIVNTIYHIASRNNNRVIASEVLSIAAADGIPVTNYRVKKTFSQMRDLGLLTLVANHHRVNVESPEFQYVANSIQTLIRLEQG